MSQSVFYSRVEIPVEAGVVHDFLIHLSNHEQLQPPQVQDWRSDENTIHFSIQALGGFSLNLETKATEHEVRLIASSGSPIPLAFKWDLQNGQAGLTQVELSITAELNMMMKMLASGPIQQLANFQTGQLLKILS